MTYSNGDQMIFEIGICIGEFIFLFQYRFEENRMISVYRSADRATLQIENDSYTVYTNCVQFSFK